MRRRNRLILNLVALGLITTLLWRDRALNGLFEVVISQRNQTDIIIPGYLRNCEEAELFTCQKTINNQVLSLKGTTGKDCQATYGKQNITCTRVQASALNTVYIDDLQLNASQKKFFKWEATRKSILSLRFLEDESSNAVLLSILLSTFSIFSAVNVSESLVFYWSKGLALLCGLSAFLALSLYFYWLLSLFGYIDRL